MVEGGVDVDSIDSFVVKFKVKEFARFFELEVHGEQHPQSYIQVYIPMLSNLSKS
jgi:hypothetical protein